MATLEELIQQQVQTGENIQSIIRNYKKDPSERKKTLTYFEERIRRVDDAWAQFEQIDTKIRMLPDVNTGHEYFTKNYYNEVMALVEAYKEEFEQQIIHFNKAPAPQPVLRSISTVKEVGISPQVDVSGIVRKQAAAILSLQRICDGLVAINDDQPPQYYELKTNTINRLWRQIETHNSTIWELCETPESQGYEISAYNDMEDTVQQVLINLAVNSSKHTSPEASPMTNSQAKLPKITIPKFDGDYLQWRQFYDLFSEVIHKQQIPNTQKMWYLKASVTGEAESLIRHLTLSNENYDTAWKLLQDRYNNKRIIVSTIIQKILNQPGMPSNPSAADIRSFHDTTQEGLLALNNLAIETNSWSPLLLQILLSKLDKRTRMLYEQSLEDPRELQQINDLLAFLEKKFQSLEAAGCKSNASKVVASTVAQSQSINCGHCNNDSHPLYQCKSFLQATIHDRIKTVQKLKLCMNCLRRGHRAQECRSRLCNICSKRHNSLLHDIKLSTAPQPLLNKRPQGATPAPTGQNKPGQATLVTTSNSGYVLLGTIKIKIASTNGKYIECRAILDSGSQVNLITANLVNRLKLHQEPNHIWIEGVAKGRNSSQHSVSATILSRINNFALTLKAFVVPSIISPQPTRTLKMSTWPIPQNIQLADPHFNVPGAIDLLIGAEHYHSLLSVGQIKLAANLPSLQKTVFGWTCSGKIGDGYDDIMACGITSTDEELNNLLARFWQLDEVSAPENNLTEAERKCEALFAQHTQRNEKGRFIVKIPFKTDPSSLGESKRMAMNRFLSLERRLNKTPQLKEPYVQFMKEYEALGHMERIDEELIPSPHYIIPHHCVLKPDSSTTKLRVVFDASAKTSSGVSLNDIMHNGPVVQSELRSLLMRFRCPRFVFTTDIEKMYRQIRIHSQDEQFQIIIWRENSREKLQWFKLKTVTYGTRSAPYLATKCLQNLAKTHRSEYPLGTAALEKNFYVDDGLCGSDSLLEAVEIKRQLNKLLESAGFKLRKWCANHAQLLQGIPLEEQEVDLDFDNNSDKCIKTLGLSWLPKSDEFCIRTNELVCRRVTKRSVTSEIAHIFDPLGLMAPVIVKAKIFVQRLWQIKLDWDEALPTEMHTSWNNFRRDLKALNDVRIPRHINNHKSVKTSQLHVFTDASECAYGAAVYVRSQNNDGTISVHLLCSKSRVAPLKTQTIPRLELCAAVLGAQLVTRVKQDLTLDQHPTYLWTDSEIVLHWINSEPSSFQTFVANRISNIQELTTADQWRHVISKHNPADLLSRGVEPREINQCSTWFYGPIFLHGRQESWPETFKRKLAIPDKSELKKNVVVLTMATRESLCNMIYNVNHGNSFMKLQRIVGYVLRFIRHVRLNNRTAKDALMPDELNEALIVIIKTIQLSDFHDEIQQLSRAAEVNKKSVLHGLSVFLDDHGIIRVGGRLAESNLQYDAKHPMVLPYNDPIVKLIMQDLHTRGLHCGPQALLAQTRQRFWPIKAKIMARSIVQHCVRCTRARPQTFNQIMGNLPRDRVQPERPFFNSGVDFCGPIWIHYKIRGKRPCKAYLAVFCCFTTKAVHIEVVSDLTTEAFLGALRRFTSRRGRCQNLYCDNATNFVGAKNQLEELEESIHGASARQLITRSCTDVGISFHFIPPRSPHFGGLWEAAVKSAKHLLVRSMGESSLTYEELETLVVQIEAMLNSRPLTPMSADPNDLAALTPGHFLIGEPLTAHPNHGQATSKASLLTRWKLTNHLKNEFWTRWSGEYLNELQNRNKWKDQISNVQKDMMVIIKEDNRAPLQWPMGRIVKTYPGSDGKVRVVDVKTSTGIWKRPIHRLAPLPVCNTERQEDELPHPIEEEFNPMGPNLGAVGQRPKRRKMSCSTGLVTTMIALLMLPLVLCTPITTTKFESRLGIYFEGVGTATLINAEWKIVAYYQLAPLWREIDMFQEGVAALKILCANQPDIKVHCDGFISYLVHEQGELQHNSKLLSGKRAKRAAFDLIGNVAHSLFGVLDSTYAEEMAANIQTMRKDDNHLLRLLRNQTSVIDTTINIIKRDEIAVKARILQLKGQIDTILQWNNDIKREIQAELVFTIISTQLAMMSDNIRRIQTEIMDVLTDVHHGKISPLLVSPEQLIRELQTIRGHLPNSRALPFDGTNLKQTYKVLTAEGAVTNSYVIFEIKVPLVDDEVFEIYKLIPIPIDVNGQLITITSRTDYLLINAHRDQYLPLSTSELRLCSTTSRDTYICPDQLAKFGRGSKAYDCETQLFTNKSNTNCQTTRLSEDTIWLQMGHKSSWIYATKTVIEASVVCGKESLQLTLQGSGMITLNQECVLRNEVITIYGHFSAATEIHSSYVGFGPLPLPNNTAEKKQASTTNLTHELHLEQLTSLQKILKVGDLEHLESGSSYNSPQTVGYAALGLSVLLIVCYAGSLLKQHKTNRAIPQSQQLELRPIPQPAPQHISTSRFTININDEEQ